MERIPDYTRRAFVKTVRMAAPVGLLAGCLDASGTDVTTTVRTTEASWPEDPDLEEAVTFVNEKVISRINDYEGSSLSLYNEQLGDIEPVERIEPVEAETPAEAAAAAERLREEADRIRDAVFTKTPKKINRKAGETLVEPGTVRTFEDALNESKRIERYDNRAADSLDRAAHFVKYLTDALDRAADLLESV